MSFTILVTSQISCITSYGGNNLLDNPNQVRWKFSPEMEVPHIAWAKPLAGKPINASIIAPWYTYRDVVELCQRLSINVNPLMTDGFNQIPMTQQYDCAYPDLGEKPEVWLSLFQKRLQKPADVLVIGKIPWTAFLVNVPGGGWESGRWDSFTVDLRSRIVDKIKAGCGLFYINPYLEEGKNGEKYLYLPTGKLPPLEKGKEWKVPAVGEKIVLKKVDASDEVMRGLTGLKLPELEQKKLTDIVYTGTLGKGRILVVDYSYRFESPRAWPEKEYRKRTYLPDGGFTSAVHHSLVGVSNASKMPCSFEYLMSFTARGILWCAKREPCRIKKIEADMKQGINITVAEQESAGEKLSVELWDASRVIGQLIKKWDNAQSSLTLPELKGGTYFVNVWLKNKKGEIQDWGSVRLYVPFARIPEKLLAAIETREIAPKLDTPIIGEIKIVDKWKSGDILRLSAIDNYGRCLWKYEWNHPSANVPFRITLDPGRSVAVVLKAERLRDGKSLENIEKTICFSSMELDGDFAFILWATAVNYEDRTCRQNMDFCRRLGVDSMLHIPSALRELCLRSNMRLVHYVDRVVWGASADPRNVEFWRQLFRRSAKELAPYAPLAFTFGDETSGAPPSYNIPAPYADQDFHFFLRWMYDKERGNLNLNVLNKTWGTSFKTVDEIKVLPLTELKKQNSLAQWLCEAKWAEWRFQRLLRESMEAAWHEVPMAYYGDEGVGNIAEGWHDYYLLFKDMTICQLYDSTSASGPLFIKSFAPQKSLRGMWTGNYCYYLGSVDEEWMRSRPWRSLFYGMNSEWWWMLSLSVRPDKKPIPAFKQYAEEIAKIKSGPATLLLKAAQPTKPQVGVLYSPNTVHLSEFKCKDNRAHQSALAITCQGLTRTGYAVKVLHQSQLEDSKELDMGYKALILPAILVLSEKQIKTIHEFVKQGGLLIADQIPAQYFNNFGVPYKKDPFRSVFIKGSKENEYALGKGKAILLKESFSLNLLERYKNVLGQTYSEKQNKPLPQIFREWIEEATKCIPPVRISLLDGKPLADAEINTFENGSALYVGIDRNGRYWEGELCRWLKWDWYNEEVEVKLNFSSRSYVYDITHGEYIGQGPEVKVRLTSSPRLFAALPAKIDKVEVFGLQKQHAPGDVIHLNAKVIAVPKPEYSHVLHVSVKNSKGETLPYFEKNIITFNGAGKIDLSLAIDEQPEKYQLVIRDVASGQSFNSHFEIIKK
jgi:hypothetical protein